MLNMGHDSRTRRGGFTLLELLTVVAIIAILAAMLLPALASAKNQGRMIEEMSAGRQLMIGVQLYAEDWNGAVFPGYVASTTAVDNQNQPLFFPENARYPWRIAPYMCGSMKLIYSGLNRALLDNLQAGDPSNYVYSASLFPSLGINSYFIGGNQTEFPAATANAKFGDGTVLMKNLQAAHPSELMVFMSARSAVTGNNAQGYYHVTPPYLTTRQWAGSLAFSLTPNQWGFVAPRFNNHSVGGILDGHAESFNLWQMQDMRHWCNRASRADWVLGQ
jgi:prepilin-type N-terminal cleavage/methylation domain-containing protein